MKFKCLFALLALAAASLFAAQQQYSLVESNGSVIISFTNRYPFGVSTLEGRLDKQWVPLQNFYTTQLVGQVTLPLPPGYSDYRVRHVSIAPGNAFRNLAISYGDLSTVAGIGPVPPGTNAWLPEYEGALATTVPLSNPRAVVADLFGHVYVLEKDSHALSVIDATDGTYHTAIAPLDFFGRRQPGSIGIDPATEVSPRLVTLTNPAALFYRNEKIYVLDAGNGRVLRFTNGLASPTNGTVSLLFTETNILGQSAVITNAGGLWVSADETEAYYTDGKMLKRWEADDGVTIIPGAPFVDLAAVTVNLEVSNDIFVADRGANVVWEVNNDGVRDLIAGDGRPVGRKVGEAQFVSLAGPSSIHFLPVGGFLLGLDEGTSVWQIDREGNAAKFVFGAPGVHDGDGEWFQKGRTRPKVGNVVSVTLAPADNDILMVENGFVRRINFLRSRP